MNAQSNQMITLINSNNTHSSQEMTLPSTNQQQQDISVDSSFEAFHPPLVTTTVIPLNVCHTKHSQTLKTIPTPSINTIKRRRNQNILDRKSNSIVTTHLIGDWIIRESLEPFQQKQNKSLSSIKQSIKREQEVFSNKSNVHQWNIDDVCSFFECVLGNNYYASIIKEHLIDGVALLLLKDKHLIDIFKMQSKSRLKLLHRINKLKNNNSNIF